MINHVEALIENGYSVTPVIDKRPFIDEWQNIHGDEILLDKYTDSWNRANGMGLILGEVSGVICLDIDILKNDEKLAPVLEEIQALLPPIYSGRNGDKNKPTAMFFQYNGERAEKFIHISVEILSNGNQVVLPPSMHPKGYEYEWVGVPLQEVEPDELPVMSADLLETLRQLNYEKKENTKDVLLSSQKGRCKSGSHNYLSRMAVAKRHHNEAPGMIAELLIKKDEEINQTEDFLYFLCPTRKWKSNNVFENARSFVEEVCRNHKPNPIYDKYKTLKTGFFKIEHDDEGKVISRTPDYLGLAQYMKGELHLKTKDDCAYIYNGEFYKPIGRLGIENKVYEITKNAAGPNHLTQFAKMARIYSHYDKDFINPSDKLNLNNGILNAGSMTLTKHNPNVFFTYRLKHDFSTSTETPVFDQFLNLVSTEDQAKVLLIQEYIGYILSGCDYSKFNKILILDGGGANGKTSLINIIQGLVGDANYSSESLVSLGENRFAAQSLVGKMVNFCSEEPKHCFNATGILKKITGNDPVMVEPKHLRSFNYVNYAKFVISYNEMPFLPDRTSGMERRLMILPCITDLEKSPELKISNLQPRVAREYGAIINKCLIAFKMVQERGHFTQVEAGKARYRELVLQSDPVMDFVDKCVQSVEELTAEDRAQLGTVLMMGTPSVSADTLWDEFLKFNGSSKMTKRGFDMKIGKILAEKDGIKKERNRSNGKNTRIYTGAIIVK
jgi:P4 family phage/plasmid primase-like protien